MLGANIIINIFFIMKKLSLKKLNLGASDMLQRNQLKTVFGGGYGDGYYACCYNNDLFNCSPCVYTGTATSCPSGQSLFACAMI
ncbi:hypothetical protein [Thalassobellus sediminis]|uniref:hypothetical protein n=1 Tax=Thalassobellus sediminis TaxID=3367753 RepID=UPI0037A6B57A